MKIFHKIYNEIREQYSLKKRLPPESEILENFKTNFYIELGKILKHHRLMRGWNQKKMADFLGIKSHTTVAHIERGRSKILLHEALLYCAALNIGFTELIRQAAQLHPKRVVPKILICRRCGHCWKPRLVIKMPKVCPKCFNYRWQTYPETPTLKRRKKNK